jgi:hypothetical protein
VAGLGEESLNRADEPQSGSDAWRRATYAREEALQIRAAHKRGTMSEETEETKPEYSIEARVEWLETAVESILSAVQVRPTGERPLPPTPEVEPLDESADRERVPERRPRGASGR